MRHLMLMAGMLIAAETQARPDLPAPSSDAAAMQKPDTVMLVRFDDGVEVLRQTLPAATFYGGPIPLLPVPPGATDATSEDSRRVPTPAAPTSNASTHPDDEVTTVLEREVPGEGRYRRSTTYRFDCDAGLHCRWKRVSDRFYLVAAVPVT